MIPDSQESLNEKFEATIAKSRQLKEKPSNEDLLKLYALYKQATEGNAPTEGAYGVFDFVAKAKHHAWSALTDTPKAQAQQQYIDLVQQLG